MIMKELYEVQNVLQKITNKDNLVLRALAYVKKDIALREAQAMRGKDNKPESEYFI